MDALNALILTATPDQFDHCIATKHAIADAFSALTAPAASPRDGELARLRKIEARAWHMLDNAIDLDDATLGIERNDPDYKALDAMLPEDCPHCTIEAAAPSPATEQAGAEDDDEPICCNGRDCGCMGATRGQERAWAERLRPAAPVGADAVERVSALVVKWRERADDLAFNDVHTETLDAIDTCADELEAALAAATQEGSHD
ncbi:hypothetical protein [Noviluteimonas gilva]|uniref:Uncharacterized protein n=1 Tax=Noviluteimonas gilva TaxID=2682097 RepID=A0A7C9M0B4_9GAMM|nr:hypothetical protein [Lysobacter gilvus]MUV13528.1 hypothetical protein [Lysobacter gilvus]